MGRWDKRLINQASDVPSIIFHKILQNSLQKPFQFISFIELQNEKKDNWVPIFVYKKLWNIYIFGASDTWMTSCLSHRPSEPVYQIVDCRILNQNWVCFSSLHEFCSDAKHSFKQNENEVKFCWWREAVKTFWAWCISFLGLWQIL